MGRFEAVLLVQLLLVGCTRVRSEILTPPYFNLADGKSIDASSTCGVGSGGPERYCQLVGANSEEEFNHEENIIQGQVGIFSDFFSQFFGGAYV